MNMDVGKIGLFTRVPSMDALARMPIAKHRMRLRIYATLLALDLLVIPLAFAATNLVYLGDGLAAPGMNIAFVLLPVYLGLAANREIYCSDFFRSWHRNGRRAVTALALAGLAVLFISFYLHATTSVSRVVFTLGTVFAAVGLFATRLVLHRVTQLLNAKGSPSIVICDEASAPHEPGAITIDAALFGLRPDSSDPSARDRLGRLVRYADRVIVACPDERREAWAAVLKGCDVQGEILMHELAELGTLGATSFARHPTLIVSSGSLHLRDRVVKRAIDVAFAAMAILFLAPLMLLTAFAIKLESRGPVFFIQQRLGRGNRLFAMYKFRSMRVDLCDEAGSRSTQRGDPRVTRVGRVIRATSIDELPQLINVLLGTMSIVGPRPHALGSLAGDKLFWEVDSRYWNRHVAKPGITGLAQVRGYRGATEHQSDLVDRLQADLEYLSGWTIWRDVRILVATLKVVLHRNAY